MTWHCSVCNLSNTPQAESCRKCQKPWFEVWKPKRKNRSQSRAKKDKGKKEKKSADQETPVTPKAMVDPLFDKPWIMSTPHSKLQMGPGEMQHGKDAPLPLPPQPVLPPAPRPEAEATKEALTTEESKTLAHLRGLKAQNIELPELMMGMLQQLEARENTKVPTISHSHINKLNKLQGQLAGAQKKLASLDQEWEGFMQGIAARVHHHAQCYSQVRNETVELYKTKQEELKVLRQEIAQASMDLGCAAPLAAIKEELPDFSQQLQELQERTSLMLQQGTIDVEESPELLEMETEENKAEGEAEGDRVNAKTSKVRVQAFRHAGSPHKVAQHTLKTSKTG